MTETPHQPTQNELGTAGSGEKRPRDSLLWPMSDCIEAFGSASLLAIHLVVKHAEEGVTPTDFDVNLIEGYGEIYDAASRLSKSMPRGDRHSMRELGQAQQRLRFMALKMGDARKRTVQVLADFIVGLAGARSRESACSANYL